MTPRIPPNATFRRAEALTFFIDLCEGPGRFRVVARRQKGERETFVTTREAEVLARLSRWQTAEEVGAAHSDLVSLVERDCAFWSSVRPTRDLTGGVVGCTEGNGKVALRANAQAQPLVATSEGIRRPAHMPRRGSLDRASLGGLTLASFEMHTIVARATLQCCARHALVARDLVPLLDGTRGAQELATTPERRALLQALDSLGLLELRAPPPPWDGAARVTWLGHAGVLYESRGQRILVDPVFYPVSEPSRLSERPFDVRDLGPIDAVLITHGDNDHLNPNSLVRLPRETPIYVPSTPRVEPYQVDMCQLLWAIGCRRVIEVEPWQRLTLGEVTVVAAPFEGEDWGLTLACRTFLIHSPDLTIFANADSTSTPEVYARLREEFRIDVAFVGVTGAAETYAMPPGFGYGDFYTAWIPEERHNEWVELCNGPREAAEAARQLGARYAVGYAAGGTSYTEVSYCDRGTHGELARLLGEMGGSTRPLNLRAGEATRVP